MTDLEAWMQQHGELYERISAFLRLCAPYGDDADAVHEEAAEAAVAFAGLYPANKETT